MTPIPPIDPATIAAYWERCTAAGAVPEHTPPGAAFASSVLVADLGPV